MTAVGKPDLVDKLLGLDDEEFDALVGAEVKDEAPAEVAEALRSPDLVEHWYDALIRILHFTQAVSANRRAEEAEERAECRTLGDAGRQRWLDYSARYERWRAGTRFFVHHLQERITEAKALRTEGRNRLYNAGRQAASEKKIYTPAERYNLLHRTLLYIARYSGPGTAEEKVAHFQQIAQENLAKVTEQK